MIGCTEFEEYEFTRLTQPPPPTPPTHMTYPYTQVFPYKFLSTAFSYIFVRSPSPSLHTHTIPLCIHITYKHTRIPYTLIFFALSFLIRARPNNMHIHSFLTQTHAHSHLPFQEHRISNLNSQKPSHLFLFITISQDR